MRSKNQRLIVLLAAACCVGARTFARGDDAGAELFARVQPSLVIITTPGAIASGFVLAADGKKYLVTNEHVLRGGKPTAKLLSGRALIVKKLEVGDEQDLVRLEIETADVEGLAAADRQPNLGDKVFVFGNSEGGGVATSLAGKVLGVGPDRIEVDAGFVQGNSGSPILAEDGSVIGVATYVAEAPDANNWVNQGTRFAEARRFGLRVTNVNWVELTWDDYVVRTETLGDLETFCTDAFLLCYTDKFADPRYKNVQYTYDDAQNRRKYVRQQGLCTILTDVAAAFTDYAQKDAEAWRRARDSMQSRSMQSRNDAARDVFMSDNVARVRYEKFKKTFDELYEKPARMVVQSDWKTKRFKAEATYWLDVLRRITRKDAEQR